MCRNDDNAPSPLSYRIAVGAAYHVPLWAIGWAADIAGFAQYWLSRSKRRDYLANASGALRAAASCPPWRAFQSHALNVVELLRAAGEQGPEFMERMTLHGGQHIDRALDRGRGLILATFHSGNWELAGLMLARRGYPITTVAGEQLRPEWSDQVKALKKRHGINVVGRGAGIRSVYRDARSNRVVVLHLDGDLFEGGCDVPFLGRTVKVPRGPARLSRVLDCPTAFAYCRRTSKRRLEVIVEPAADPPTSDDGEVQLTTSLMTRVEKSVLEDPGQWCIFRRLTIGSE
jgi:lauroyl/myristoyl acyltransferase